MSQHNVPRDRRSNGWDADAPTVVLPVHRPGPLGQVHDRQRRWPAFGRFLWWAFLLPVAIFAWSSWRLRGVLRFSGYALAGWVLLIGLVVAMSPMAPATPENSVPVAQASAAPALDPTPAAAPVVPAAAPVVAVVAPAPPVVPAPASVPPTAPSAAPKATRSKPPAPRAVAAPAPASPHGDTYTNVDGNQVERPVAAAAQPAGATAECKDGTWSFSQHHSGTCSGHGGVAQFL